MEFAYYQLDLLINLKICCGLGTKFMPRALILKIIFYVALDW